MSDDIDTRLKRIRDKLKRVRRLKPAGFGWKSHRYRLNPPLEEELLTALEQAHGVTLPAEFSRFCPNSRAVRVVCLMSWNTTSAGIFPGFLC